MTTDGGWLKGHPIPSDKGRFGNFDALSQQNRRLIQQILSQDSSSLYSTAGLIEGTEDPYDTAILKKLRGFYASCMDEDLLDARGTDPLLHIVRNVRRLFEGEGSAQDDKQKQRKGLTAAVAYLHTKGLYHSLTHRYHYSRIFMTGITALFDTDIEGDAGRDPNDMTLWFSQPSLGLPAKVS